MSKESLISIIVPIYKVERFLPQCIDSILAQTHQNIEIILVDDGSPDQCPRICDTYAKLDPRITVIHKPNGGVSDARNAGIEIAQGDYIGFVDSDDYIHPQMYEKLLHVLEDNNADMSMCSFESVDISGNPLPKNNPIKTEILSHREGLRKIKNESTWQYLILWNKLYKKELFAEIRFPAGKINEDQFVAHKIFDFCQKTASIQEKLYYYVQRNNSITSTQLTVKNFDDVEALCDRVHYYEQKGYFDLQEPLANYLYDRYITIRLTVYGRNQIEKARIREIDHMVREAYPLANKQFSLNRQLLLRFPDLGICFLRLRKKLR